MPLPMFQSKNQQVNREKSLSRIKYVVGIAAGKGGVGKSTVSVNLARALQIFGYHVGVIDADIYGPSIRKMLPEDSLPSQNGEIITPAICSGLKTISMAYFCSENKASAIRAPIANGIVSQFIKNVDWGILDFLLIDFPPGTGDVQLTLSQQANLCGVVMVTTPQEVAILDVRKAINMFDQVKIPVVGIVENMSYYCHPSTKDPLYLFGRGGGTRLAQEIGVPFLGKIPIDQGLSDSGDTGLSIFNHLSSVNVETINQINAFAHLVVHHVEAIKNRDYGILQNFELIWKDMGKG